MKKWFIDQPFQARSSICLSHPYFSHLERYEDALKVARQGLVLHPNEWALYTTCVISSCLLGSVDQSLKYLQHLERFSDDREASCYIFDASGMIDFQVGWFEDRRSVV